MKSDVAPPKTCVNDLHVRTEKYFFSTGSRSLKNSAVSQFLLLPLVKWVKRAPNKPTNQTTKQPTKQPTNQPNNQTTNLFFRSGLHISWEHRRLSGQKVGQCCVAQCRVWRSSSAPQWEMSSRSRDSSLSGQIIATSHDLTPKDS